MLADNPLLTFLGRRGRGAVVEALLGAPGRAWTVSDLARAAGVPSAVASRAVRELASLGAVESLRPRRDRQVRFRPANPAGRFLAGAGCPDLRAGAAEAFAAAYAAPPGVLRLLRYDDPSEDPADPASPTRVAVVTGRDEEAALDAAGPALDAARAAGWPPVEVATFTPAALREDDAVARAVRSGRALGLRNRSS